MQQNKIDVFFDMYVQNKDGFEVCFFVYSFSSEKLTYDCKLRLFESTKAHET